MLTTIYCRINEWSKAEKILSKILRIKRERQLSTFDTRHSLTEINFETAIQPLLEMRANIHPQNKTTALHLAIESRCERIVWMLLEMNANVNAKNKNDITALFRAASYEHETITHLLLKNESDAEEKNNSRRTTLH